MGQYHVIVNLDKREFLDPHEFGCGLKLWEQAMNHPGVASALLILLACSSGRGGGDFKDPNTADEDRKLSEKFYSGLIKLDEMIEQRNELLKDPDPVIGRWAGDKIAIVGDYAEDDDLPAEYNAKNIYMRCMDDKDRSYTDISDIVIPYAEFNFGVKYEGAGWRNIVKGGE